MSREVKIAIGKDAPAEAAEILAEIEAAAGPNELSRQDAVARCLSASEGWKEAIAALGGAFAPSGAADKVKQR